MINTIVTKKLPLITNLIPLSPWIKLFENTDKNYSEYKAGSIEHETIETINTIKYFSTDIGMKGQDNIKENELVSVVVSLYNCSKYVAACVASILAQTYHPIELILVDDCSTDDTYEVACGLSSADGRIKVIKTKSNSGTYVAKNLGLISCNGRYVAFQDCDDISHPERIDLQIQALKSGNHFVASACHYARFSINTGELLLNRNERSRAGLITLLLDWYKIREYIGFFDSVRVNADDEFKNRIRAFFGDQAICELPDCKYYALMRENSLTTSDHTANDISQIKIDLFLAPVRKLYTDYFKSWHRNATKQDLYIEFPQKQRSFKAPASIDPFNNTRFSKHSLMINHLELDKLKEQTALHKVGIDKFFDNILVACDAPENCSKLNIDAIGGIPVHPIIKMNTIDKTMKNIADFNGLGSVLFIENPADLRNLIGNQLRRAMYLMINARPTPVTVSFIDCDAIYFPLELFNISSLQFVDSNSDFIRSFALTTIFAGGQLKFV